MKTIKWLVSLVPKESRALFACLLIAIMSLTTVVVRQDKKISQGEVTYQKDLQNITNTYQGKIDTLNKVIFIIKDNSKKEALESLERIISDQKQIIEEQKKQNKLNGGSNTHIKLNK